VSEQIGRPDFARDPRTAQALASLVASRVPLGPKPGFFLRPRQKKCHTMPPFCRSISLKTNETCTKEVSHFFKPLGIAGLPKGAAPRTIPPHETSGDRKKKWDTVPLLFSRNSLKTKKTHTEEVGHFFDYSRAQERDRLPVPTPFTSHYLPVTGFL
jgi:hypothetical protein